MTFTVFVEPMGKPRQTHADKWLKRDCVVRYHRFANTIKAEALRQHLDLSDVGTVCVSAYFSLPASWSKKKKNALSNQAHRQTPDADNVIKGIMDALFARDEGIHSISLMKRWDDGKGARLEITIF